MTRSNMLKIFILILGSLLSYCSALPCFASSLNHEIQTQIKKNTPKASVGILIQELKPKNNIIYSYHADQEFIPASNMKVITAITAMKLLGPDYQFKTSISRNPQDPSNNLIIKFTGDPSLSSADLINLIHEIRTSGILKITGNIILDVSQNNDSDYPIGIDHDDLAYCFMAPAQSIILNQNCLTVGTGKSTTIMADQDPIAYAQNIITQALKDNQISFSGKFMINTTPLAKTSTLGPANPFKMIAEHDSEPLPNLINNMLPWSDNLYAASLTKVVGFKSSGIGSYQTGAEALDQTIQNLLQNFNHQTLSPGHVIKDGAGLSRDNQMTPQDFVKILSAAYQDPVLKNMLFDSLPRSGISGSLKTRMTSHLLLGNVYAKTGSMRGISTLSGYLKTPSGKIFVFSIMINNLPSFIGSGRALQDEILNDLAKAN